MVNSLLLNCQAPVQTKRQNPKSKTQFKTAMTLKYSWATTYPDLTDIPHWHWTRPSITYGVLNMLV